MAKKNKQEEIKPCPFCGRYPFIEDHTQGDEVDGWCAHCHSCDFTIWAYTMNSLLKKWNRRHLTTASTRLAVARELSKC